VAKRAWHADAGPLRFSVSPDGNVRLSSLVSYGAYFANFGAMGRSHRFNRQFGRRADIRRSPG